jgi:hypothetical protein
LTTLPPGDANCPYGGTKLTSGDAVGFACNGAPGVQGGIGPAGTTPVSPVAELLYVKDTATSLVGSGEGLLSKSVALPVWTTEVAPVLTFPVTVADASSTFVIRLDATGIGAACQTDATSASTSWQLSMSFKNTSTGDEFPVRGVQVCADRTSIYNAYCADGFTFTATIPPGAIPSGSYEGRLSVGGSCSTTMWTGSASWSIGPGVLLVTRYR